MRPDGFLCRIVASGGAVRDSDGQVERAIVNLITNALKYSPSDAPVLIRVTRSDHEAVIAVIDQGRGISAEELPHLFQRFYRAKAGNHAEGLGLGLYITRRIV